jgi:DNA-binding GntR family transcriptional regulator
VDDEDGLSIGRSRGRLADEVYDRLLGQLMSLRIVPGSRVTIDALARELGVSQTPIRDALNRMEADDLVVRVPHAGYRIPPQITRERFEDMLEIRLLLERRCTAARRPRPNWSSPAAACRVRRSPGRSPARRRSFARRHA